MAFKNGKRFNTDLERGQAESNWFFQIAEDHVPAAAGRLSDEQLEFLASLAEELERIDWEVPTAEKLDIERALELQELFHEVLDQAGLSLRDGLRAVYDCFVDRPFTMQIGFFLIRLERPFALSRLHDVSGSRVVAA